MGPNCRRRGCSRPRPGRLKSGAAPKGGGQYSHVIRDGLIIISIEVAALPLIVSGSCAAAGLDGFWKVTDSEAFSREVVRALNDEEEDGTTRVHRLFDAAFNEAINQGAEGIEEVDDDEFEAEAARLQAEAARG